MHGRPRNYQDKLKDPKVAEAYRKKVDAIKAGTTLVLRCRAAHRHDAAALTAADRLLRVVPELYTVWNFRREAARAALEAAIEAARRLREKEKDDNDDAALVARGEAALAAELELSQACLQENPKSYCTWHHRRWALDQGIALRGGIASEEEEEEEQRHAPTAPASLPSTGRALLERELALVARALEADSRNFHAWAHRRWVARRLGVSAARELAFAGAKVAADFSNYSAWHQRSLLLGEAVAEQQQRALGEEEQGGQEGQGAQEGQEVQQQARVATLDEVLRREGGGGVGPSADAPTPAAPSSAPLLPPDVLDAEFDVVHSAFVTDSRDQSPWVYYAWLVGQALARLRAARAALRRAEEEEEEQGSGGLALALARAREADARAEAADRLARERARLEEEHLADDPDARWPLLTVARLKEAQARLGLFLEAEEEEGDGDGDGDGGPAARLLREARDAY